MYRFAVITAEGANLLTDTTANNNLKITKILCGDGLPDGIEDCLTEEKIRELMKKQKALVSGQARFNIESYTVENGVWSIRAEATKETAPKAFKSFEAGLYGKRTTDTKEVMIAYFLAGDYLQGKLNDTADYVFIPTGGKATITLPISFGTGIEPEFVLAEDLHFSIEEGEDTEYITPRKFRILTVKDEFGTHQTKIMDGMDGMPVGATYKQYPSVYKKVTITADEFAANPGKYYQAGTGDAQNNDPFDVATSFVSGRQYFECIYKSYRPQQIYGGEWRDCTEAFAGYFERAEGGNSGAFGTNADGTPKGQDSQNKSHKHTTSKHTHGFTPSGSVSAHSHGLNGHAHSFTPKGSVESHRHSFTPKGTLTFAGAHYHYVNAWDEFNPDTYGSKTANRSNAYILSSGSDTYDINILTDSKDATDALGFGEIVYPAGGVKFGQAERCAAYPWIDCEGNGIDKDNRMNGKYVLYNQKYTSYSGYHSHIFTGTEGTTVPTTPTFTGKAGTTGAASGNTENATPTFTGKAGTTGEGGGADTGTEGGNEARPVNIAYRMWQRVA